MDRKCKTVFITFLLFLFPLLLGAADSSMSVSLIKEEVHQRSRFKSLSVSPHDEVAIGFSSGAVYLYNADGEFVCGYQFPETDSAFSIVFTKNDTIGYYLDRSRTLTIYNREGKLQEVISLNGSENYDNIIRTKRLDSRGVKYEKKNNTILKIYPDGTQEIFYELSAQGNDIAAEVLIVPVCLYALFKWCRKLIFKR